MGSQKKKNIKPVVGRILVPPYDDSDFTIIGHWDENEKKFTPVSSEIMNRFIQAQWRGYKLLPLKINVRKTLMDGELHSYRAFGSEKEERTIVFIDTEDILMPTYEEFITKQDKKTFETIMES